MQMRPDGPLYTKPEVGKMNTGLFYIDAFPSKEVRDAVATIRRLMPVLQNRAKDEPTLFDEEDKD